MASSNPWFSDPAAWAEVEQQWNQGWLPQQQANQIRSDAANAALTAWGRTQRPNSRYV